MKKIYLFILVLLTAYSGIAQRIPRPGYKATVGSCSIQQIVAMVQADPRFSDACNKHDRCYQTCNSSKVACDEEFYRGLIAACNNDAQCLALADVFFHAISNSDAGREAYDAAQRRACISCDELIYFKQPNITVPFCEGEQAPVEVMPLLAAGVKSPQFVWSNGTSGSQRTVVRPIDPAAISVSVTFTGDDNKPYTCAANATVTWKQSDCSGNAEKEWYIPIIEAIDPNDIIGPEGYGPGKMVSSKKPLPYTIRFENDSTVATAAAQIVRINQKLDAKLDARTLRLGSFGFAGMTFEVPADRSYYSSRLDVMDSLGVVVDVIAGINVETGEAFWIFESKDPATDLPPTDATLGFLPVNTPDHKGEGFVSYTIQAAENVHTGDTVHAKASIVFDINGAIETPPIWNTLDAGDPTSNMKLLPENSRGTELKLEWEGTDDANGSGVKVYDVFVSKDNAPFTLYKAQVAGNTTTFSGDAGNYRFFSIATDNVEHRETRKTDEEASTNWTPALACNNDTTVAPDNGVCTAIVNGIDPQRGDLPATTVFSYTLTGATTGTGTGTVSGRTFNQGVTTVTYTANTTPALTCTFTVTVSARQEICDNQIDDDCDGAIDEDCAPMRTWYRDADGDNYGNPNDSRQSTTQPPGYVIDNSDCDDDDETIHPGATEICDDNKDNDCDGQTDEGCPEPNTWYRDADADGYGDINTSQRATTQPPGYVADNSDCNDNDNTIHPGATEICDNKDNNCDGQTDEGCQTWYRDADGDGFGDNNSSQRATTQPPGYVADHSDCNDNDNTIYPNAPELCDSKDNDCDGTTDEGCPPIHTWYRDADGDNFGNPAISTTAPAKPDGYVDNNTDCNDNDNTIYPGAAELCDNKDNDCDGQTDEGCPVSHPTWYRDADGDNFGDPNSSVNAANKPDGYVANNTDCNDNDNTIYPNAPEVCDNKDNNCNGTTDENCIPQGVTWYRDKDGDGFGNKTETRVAVTKPTGYVDNDKDCNDDNANVHPGATEICDGIDNNCDGRGDDCAPGLYVKAAPNPSRSYFKLIINSDSREGVTVMLRNAMGKTVQVVKVPANTTPEIGHNLRPGVYYAEIVQGTKRAMVKLVKLL